MVNINAKIILKIFFLAFSKIDAYFTKQKLIRSFYNIVKILLTIKKIEIIN